MGMLKGKVAVVVGGGGIGGASARRLAAAGGRPAIGDLDAGNAAAIAAQITKAGGDAQGSLRYRRGGFRRGARAGRRRPLRRAGSHARQCRGCAIAQDSNAVDVDLGVFERTLAANLRGHLLCTRQAIPQMLSRGGGALVYTSSNSAFIGESERPCYAMAKAGINALMRHVASRWANRAFAPTPLPPVSC